MPNNVLELTRLSRLELRVVFGFADGLPAKTLLQTRLTAQHCRSAGARAAELLNGAVIRLLRPWGVQLISRPLASTGLVNS